jgi:hypothetical protein
MVHKSIKPIKVYQNGKFQLAVFRNKNKRGKEYLIFALQFSNFFRPPKFYMKRCHVAQLKALLSKIEIRDDEGSEEEIENENSYLCES